MPDPLRAGAAFAVAAAAAFAVTAACVKAASATVGTEMVVFFRNAVSLAVLLPWLLRRGGPGLRTRRLGGHLWRAALGLCSMYCFFYAIAHLHLAESLLLTYSTPLYIPFIAWLWLREPPPAVIFPALVLGTLGIVLIARPGAAGFAPLASAAGALSGLLAAGAMVTIRRISDTEPATRIVFYFSALATTISAVPLLWAWRSPDARELALLAACGASATVGQLCLTRAYALAPAARIGAITYVSVVFAGALGWWLWSERPDASSLAGMALVLACCLLALWRRPAAGGA